MEVLRLIFYSALFAASLGLILEIFVPASAPTIDAAAAVFAAATWIIPLLLTARTCIWPPKGSLAKVGDMIGIVTAAACLSAIALLLALLTVVFAQARHWAGTASLAILGFWIFGVLSVYIGARFSPAGRKK